MITMSGLTVRFGATTAVRNLTVSVARGRWCALIGPNGSGKTTALRAVAGLVAHDGTVEVDGVDLVRVDRRSRANLVAYVPQQPLFPADMLVSEYVLLGQTPHLRRFRSETKADRQVCDGLLERLDLTALRGRRLATMSGGERQRLVLARALAQQAPVLLLDEPTSALDLGRRIDALELVDDLRREHALTVVTAIHDLTLAGQFADSLALLKNGTLTAHDTPGRVLVAELLTDAFDAPVQVVRHHNNLLVTSLRTPGSTGQGAS